MCLIDASLYLAPEASAGVWLLPNALLGYPEPGVHHPYNTLLPTSKEEIVHIIQSVLAAANSSTGPHRIRVIGSGHSWSRVAISDNLLLSLERYKVCV